MGAVLKIGGIEAPVLGRPVDSGAADTLTGIERTVLPHWQRGAFRARSPGPGFLREIDHQIATHLKPELVVIVEEIALGGAQRSLLDRDNRVSRLRELLRQNAAGPASADGDDINFWQICHR